MYSMVFSTNHKDIGTLYFFLDFFYGLIGTLLSVVIEIQFVLSPGYLIINYHTHNVTAYVLIIIFFVVIPAWIGGFWNWFFPILIGVSDRALPSLNNFSFRLLPPSLFLLLFCSTLIEGGAITIPLTDSNFNTIFFDPAIVCRDSLFKQRLCLYSFFRFTSLDLFHSIYYAYLVGDVYTKKTKITCKVRIKF